MAAPVVPPVPAAAVVAVEGAKLLIAVYVSAGEWLRIPGNDEPHHDAAVPDAEAAGGPVRHSGCRRASMAARLELSFEACVA